MQAWLANSIRKTILRVIRIRITGGFFFDPGWKIIGLVLRILFGVIQRSSGRISQIGGAVRKSVDSCRRFAGYRGFKRSP
jgi:hypothetical protein